MAADEAATRIGVEELPRSEGAEGSGGNFPRFRVQEARPPSCRRHRGRRPFSLTMGSGSFSVEDGDDQPTSGATGGHCKETGRPEGLQDQIVTIFATETPKGRLGGARGGFSPAVSPIT